jgi:YgiT-type zinc finger domain-containing protein
MLGYEDNIQCMNCRIGTLRRGKATYTVWFHGQLVVLPNVNVWMCDVCGDFAYDDDTITRVEMLLGDWPSQPAHRPTDRASAGPQPGLPPNTDPRPRGM